jgi:DNA-binding XRE family transcriptional regulator
MIKHEISGPASRKLREESGVSQAIAARLADVSQPTLNRFEHGLPIRADLRARLISAYHEIFADAENLRGMSGRIDLTWSKRQIETFIRSNAVTIVYTRAGDPSSRCYVLQEKQIQELCRLHLLAAGKSV